MRRREEGQVAVAGVGIAILLMLAMLVLVHLAAIRSGGARGQSAADISALAAAKVLSGNPGASADTVRTAADRAAAANGARVERFHVEGSPGAPTAVDVTVSELVSGSVPGAGQRNDRVRSWSRAGVTYSATLDQASFRPVDLKGATGAAAVVAAAEAQIGWPYVWGGESRAEGGFDCSGLIDYAYGAAGMPLPGRPTAAVLFSMSRRITESELAPGDLVFLGSPNAYHVGMYVGGGETVVAPHTGAQVSFEPLAENPWDGFGRLLAGPPVNDPLPTRAAGAAVTYGVAPNVLQALMAVKPATDPVELAASLKSALAKHHDDMMAALTDMLDGDASAAALVMHDAAGAGLPVEGTIKLLPRGEKYYEPSGGGSSGGSWWNLVNPVQHGAGWLHHVWSNHGLNFSEHLGHGSNLLLDVTSVLPNPVGVIGQLGSAGRDMVSSVRGYGSVVEELSPVARAFGFLSFLQIGLAAWGLYHARTWRGRLYNGALLLGGTLAATAFVAMLIGGAVAASPIIAAVAIAAAVITAATTIYANWAEISSMAGAVAGAAASGARKAGSWVKDKVSSGVHSVASALGL